MRLNSPFFPPKKSEKKNHGSSFHGRDPESKCPKRFENFGVF